MKVGGGESMRGEPLIVMPSISTTGSVIVSVLVMVVVVVIIIIIIIMMIVIITMVVVVVHISHMCIITSSDGPG